MCYTIPLTAAIITAITKKKIKTPYSNWLNLMLWGGSIMLVIDHLLNGELFLIGKNIGKDLLVGVAMTAMTFLAWGAMIFVHKFLKVRKIESL